MLAIVGGSGLYNFRNANVLSESLEETPFGEPSSPIRLLEIEGQKILFLARHGLAHELLPSELNYRANLFALKKLGAQSVLGVSAVGSLVEDIRPGDLVIPNQLVDRTTGRCNTFFGSGVIAHFPMAKPFSVDLSAILYEAAFRVVPSYNCRLIPTATYICIDGPQFSSKAESSLYRSWNMDVIGMTVATEAKLAKEAQLPYSSLCMVSDYDAWKDSNPDEVDTKALLHRLSTMNTMVEEVIINLAKDTKSLQLPKPEDLLKNALVGDLANFSDKSWLEILAK